MSERIVRCDTCGAYSRHVAGGQGACCYWRQKHIRESNRELAREAYARKALYLKAEVCCLAPAEVDRLLSAQGEKCAICSRNLLDSARTAVVDVSEEGDVRGLLCRTCEKGLVAFGEKRDVLLSALLYVKEHGARMTP